MKERYIKPVAEIIGFEINESIASGCVQLFNRNNWRVGIYSGCITKTFPDGNGDYYYTYPEDLEKGTILGGYWDSNGNGRDLSGSTKCFNS